MRFPDDIANSWKQVFILDIGSTSKGEILFKDEIEINGKYDCVLYGELYTYYNEHIETILSKTNKEISFNSSTNCLIFPSSTTVNALSLISPSSLYNSNVILGGDMIIKKLNQNYDAHFTALSILKNKTKFAKLAQGSTIIHILSSDINKQKLWYPEIRIQKKISYFMSLIDKRIELQNKIIKDYELLKKVLNYRLFNYDNDNSFLRFPEFSGEWTKRKIKNILKCYSTSYSMVDILLEGETPIYDANTLVGYINECGYKEKYIAIIKDGASVGTIRLLPKNTTHISTINGLLSQTENIDFLYFALQGLNFTKYIVGSGIPHIYFRDYSSMNISVPSSKEQLKIANFLSKLDEILLNVKCEKERLIKNKTFLLQNLFI